MYIKYFSFLVALAFLSCNDSETKAYIALGDSHITKFDFNYYTPHKNVDNLGENGLTLSGLINKIENLDPAEQRLLLHIGTNDYIEAIQNDINEEDFTTNQLIEYDTLFRLLQPFEQVYILGTIPPTNSFFEPKAKYTLTDLELLIIEKTTTQSNIEFVSTNILQNEDQFLSTNYTTDHLHLNNTGYEILTQKINEALR